VSESISRPYVERTEAADEAATDISCATLSILIPVYDDWTSAQILFVALSRTFTLRPDLSIHLLVVDDGSNEARPHALVPAGCPFRSVTVLRLIRNLGHQRAIATGLAWLGGRNFQDAVLIMDGDGEDRPEDACRLIDKFLEANGEKAVFAARRRRTETRLFWAGYHCYRLIHRVVTGITVEIGNFSVIPAARLGSLTFSTDLWSHYAACAVKAGVPMCKIPIDRGRRLAGRSKMNYVSLTHHGLSALGVFSAIATTRLLLTASAAAIFVAITLVVSYMIRIIGGLDLSILVLQTIGITSVFLMFCLVFAAAILLTAVADRGDFPLPPARDYWRFIERTETFGS
jgi:hypothetical protein